MVEPPRVTPLPAGAGTAEVSGLAGTVFASGFTGQARAAIPLPVRVFLSSPGDVAEERRVARRVLEKFSRRPLLLNKVTIDVVSWDDPEAPVPMLANLTPQDSVNRARPTPAECDFTIVILWGRLGTPLAEHRKDDGTPFRSGTEWEYESARKAGKDVLLYRRTGSPNVGLDDPLLDEKRRQKKAVDDFFAAFKRDDGSMAGSYTSYETPAAFEERLANDVEWLLDGLLKAKAPSTVPYLVSVQTTGLDPVAAGLQLVFPAGASPAQLVRSSQSKPRLDEIFDVLTDGDEIAKALFRTETKAWAPYDVEYVRGRVGIDDAQQALADALRDSGGRLLVTGRAGIGKTREATDLAVDHCERGWVVLVARPDADARLGAVGALPPELRDARVLLVVDDLHARVASAEDDLSPVLDRLAECIESLARQSLDDIRVIAIARDEPRFEKVLGLTPGSLQWRGFTRFHLPDLTTDGLSRILSSLAARYEVGLDAESLPALVTNSDRTPRTLFINVNLARRRKARLDRDSWLPSEGETWQQRLRTVRGRNPTSEQVHASIRLFSDLRLPARFDYIVSIGPQGERAARAAAAEALVDEGLVGRRRNQLALFSHESPEETSAASVTAVERWTPAIEAISGSALRSAEWIDDMTALALGLLRADLPTPAIAVSTQAIEAGGDSAALYRARAGGRFLTNARSLALEDMNAAIVRDPDDPNSWFLRGQLHYLDGDSDGVLADLTKARSLGHDAGILHMQSGFIHYQREQWPEACAAFDLAVEREGPKADGIVFFLRGVSRQRLGDLPGAESDFDAALSHASSYEAGLAALPALADGRFGDLRGIMGDPLQGSHGHHPLVHAARAEVRARRERWAEAVDDFSIAIDSGFSATMVRIFEALSATPLPFADRARRAMDQGLAQLRGDAMLYLARGVARRELGQVDPALTDFAVALEGGVPQARVERAVLHLRVEQIEAARADLDGAVAEPSTAADGHALRGILNLTSGMIEEAETDLDNAIRLGRDDALVRVWRARVGIARGNLAAAAADFDEATVRPNPPPDAWLGRASVRLDLGDAAGAEADAGEALARGAHAATAHTLRGAARINLGRLGEAEEDLSHAIALGRNDHFVYRWRGTARMRLLRGDAEADFDRAIERGDREPSTLFLRGCTRLDADKPGPAHDDFEAAVAAGFDVAGVRGVRGIARQRLSRHSDAEADLEAAIDGGATEALVWFSRGEARAALGKTQGAIDDMRHALALQPRNLEVAKRLAELLVVPKRYAAAIRVLDAAVEAYGERLDLRLQRARTALLAGRFETAAADLDILTERLPDEPGARILRSQARYGLGNASGAISDLDAMLAREPENAAALGDRAEAQTLAGRLDLAERDVAAMAAHGPAPDKAIGVPALLALARGDLDEAREGFEQAESADPTGSWGFRLALVHLVAGRLEDARVAVTRTLSTTCPGDARIAQTELDTFVERIAVDVPGADVIRALLDAAWRVELDD